MVLLLIVVAGQAVAKAEPARPNILFFYVDDMGWGAIGPNGQAARRAKGLPSVQTPNIDQLAAEGVNFSRGYGCHVCSPARSSLQSGFHQGHTFADRNDPNNAKKAMRADEILIGDALSAAGYVTGYWGKWGYGGSKDQASPVIENIQTLPTSHGFQHVLAELHHVRAHTFFQPTLWSAPATGKSAGGLELIPNSMTRFRDRSAWPELPARQNDSDYPDTAYCDDSYAFAALEFVRTQGQNYNRTGQPFIGILGVQIPHAPFGEIATLPGWDEAYKDDPHFASLADQSRQWAAMVTRIDAHFGNILASLEDPNGDGDTSDSIADNTLVLFQSDNGGPAGKNNVELNANGGLSGHKGRIQEGGIRVPLVMRWPAKITPGSQLKAGSSTSQVVDVTDLLPTFCELAGAPVPLGVDGVSIAPTLTGEGHQRPRDFIIHEAGNGQSIIHGRHKLVRTRNAPLKLYDLEVDPSESDDLSKQHPRLVRKLEKVLLGERVAEPRGFANTYHHWIGSDGANTSDPGHWSDYRYSNAGITYLEDTGSPQLSWIALIENQATAPRTAQVDADLEVLGLEVRGGEKTAASQTLVVGSGITLHGRNEVRVTRGGILTTNGGSISSLRWVDIQSEGMLTGHGSIGTTVYNDGKVVVKTDGDSRLQIEGDYHQTGNAALNLPFSESSPVSVNVKGDAYLGGTLELSVGSNETLESGQTITVLSAGSVQGRFANANNELITADGARFRIDYSDNLVRLFAK